MSEISYGQRFRDLASANPNAPIVTVVSGVGAESASISWGEMDDLSNRLARELSANGVGLGDFVTIALPNGLAFFSACIASWKVGAIPQPVSSRLPPGELEAIVALADARAVIGVTPARFTDRFCLAPDHMPAAALDCALPDRISPSWKAPTSGGSTGRPKLIVSGDPAVFDDSDPGFAEILKINPGATTVMPGPMYHNGPFVWAFTQLLLGGHVVLLEHFDSAATLWAIEYYRGNSLYLVPTMMTRIWRLTASERSRYDLRSLQVVWHLAAPCPVWLKKEWIAWLGPERVWELYGGTEGQAATVISGSEWLAHEGSVGRAAVGELRILDDKSNPLAPGEVGEVYMRPDAGRVTYHYLGAEAKSVGDGWESLGDMGWMDDEGYLYLTDRRSDMILSGGANVYPAEVEAALEAHGAVVSCAVIGLPDDDLGQRVHAIVQANGVSEQELIAYVAERLVRYKVPRSVEFVDHPVRDDAGKVRRSALLAERVGLP